MTREEALERALVPFTSPRSSVRHRAAGAPETDALTVTASAADWMRACVLLGRMDRDYLEILPEDARPSEAFLDEISELEKFAREEPLLS